MHRLRSGAWTSTASPFPCKGMHGMPSSPSFLGGFGVAFFCCLGVLGERCSGRSGQCVALLCVAGGQALLLKQKGAQHLHKCCLRSELVWVAFPCSLRKRPLCHSWVVKWAHRLRAFKLSIFWMDTLVATLVTFLQSVLVTRLVSWKGNPSWFLQSLVLVAPWPFESAERG